MQPLLKVIRRTRLAPDTSIASTPAKPSKVWLGALLIWDTILSLPPHHEHFLPALPRMAGCLDFRLSSGLLISHVDGQPSLRIFDKPEFELVDCPTALDAFPVNHQVGLLVQFADRHVDHPPFDVGKAIGWGHFQRRA